MMSNQLDDSGNDEIQEAHSKVRVTYRTMFGVLFDVYRTN